MAGAGRGGRGLNPLWVAGHMGQGSVLQARGITPTINTNGTWTYLTLVWHGTNLLAIVAESAADQPPAAYTAAVDSLVWKA